MKGLRLLPLLASVAGCALFTKADPMEARYFSVEPPGPPSTAKARETSSLELRLGKVNANAFIQDRIVVRDASYEVEVSEGRRWTEKPETYVRRALSRALFDQRGVRQIVSGPGPTLEVDVVAFEEVRAPQHVGRVSLTYALTDERVVILSRTTTVDRPVAEASGAAKDNAAIQAIAEALVAAAGTVADEVTKRLSAEPRGRDETSP